MCVVGVWYSPQRDTGTPQGRVWAGGSLGMTYPTHPRGYFLPLSSILGGKGGDGGSDASAGCVVPHQDTVTPYQHHPQDHSHYIP